MLPYRVFSLLQMQPSCNRPSLPQRVVIEVYKFLVSPKLLFLGTQRKGTLQSKLRILTNLQDPYLSTTSNVNLLTRQSSNMKILFKRDSSSWTQTGVSTSGDRTYRMNNFSKPPSKIDKLSFRILLL